MNTSMSDSLIDYDNVSPKMIVSRLDQLSNEIAYLHAENERLHQQTHDIVFHTGYCAAFSTGILLAFVIKEYIR